MNSEERDKRWMAYMDGQMGASESLDFEEALSRRERARLDGEVRLESAIHDALAGGETCPAALWNKLALQMQQSAPAKRRRLAYWFSRSAAVLAATAAIIIAAPYFIDGAQEGQQAQANTSLGIQETSLEEFRSASIVPANFAAAQSYLRDNNIDLKLVRLAGTATGHHHEIEFVGVCVGRCPGKTLFELRFICCGEPAKVMIARRGTDGERMLREATRCGDIGESRISEKFITAVVGGHGSTDLLDLIQPSYANLT